SSLRCRKMAALPIQPVRAGGSAMPNPAQRAIACAPTPMLSPWGSALYSPMTRRSPSATRRRRGCRRAAWYSTARFGRHRHRRSCARRVKCRRRSSSAKKARARRVRSLLVEAGPRLAGALFAASLVQRVVIFRAPFGLGDSAPGAFAFAPPGFAERLHHAPIVERQQLGDDVMTAYALEDVPCSPD